MQRFASTVGMWLFGTFWATIFSTCTPCVADSLYLETGPTWRAIGPAGTTLGSNINSVGLSWEAGNVGWNSNTAYDDSNTAGWTSPNLVHTDVDTNAIWLGQGNSASPSPVYFRHEFQIQGIPTAGSMYVGVDDDAQVWINGVQVFNDTNGLVTIVNGIDVSSSLVQGTNLIAIKGYNRQGDATMIATLNIAYSSVPEPNTAILAAFGLAGMVGIGWRRASRPL